MNKISCSGDDDGHVNGTPSFNILGDDIVSEILSRLSLNNLMEVMLVCKRWKSLIRDDSEFGRLHFGRSETPASISTLLFTSIPLRNTVFFKFGDESAVVPRELDLGLTDLQNISMLKPINGLTCFVRNDEGSVLIYNFTTGVRTSWINTITTAPIDCKAIEWSYGFGFDPTTNKHKVLCICKKYRKGSPSNPFLTEFDFVCEVLTVGDNVWRKIDEIPPLEIAGESLYANGSIYWTINDHDHPRPKFMLSFVVGSDKFRVINFPNSAGWPLQCFHLVEIDGCVALLNRPSRHDSENWITLWIFNDDNNDDEERSNKAISRRCWKRESIKLPFSWKGKRYFAFQAISGTNQIILKSFDVPVKLDSFHIYERNSRTNENVEVTGIPELEAPCFGYNITTFRQSLLPVKNKQIQMPEVSQPQEMESVGDIENLAISC